MLYLLLIVGVIVLDRVVKIAVTTNMEPGDTIPVIDHIFHIAKPYLLQSETISFTK